jgi:hypothetical protein
VVPVSKATLEESISWNHFLGSLKVSKYRLRMRIRMQTRMQIGIQFPIQGIVDQILKKRSVGKKYENSKLFPIFVCQFFPPESGSAY